MSQGFLWAMTIYNPSIFKTKSSNKKAAPGEKASRIVSYVTWSHLSQWKDNWIIYLLQRRWVPSRANFWPVLGCSRFCRGSRICGCLVITHQLLVDLFVTVARTLTSSPTSSSCWSIPIEDLWQDTLGSPFHNWRWDSATKTWSVWWLSGKLWQEAGPAIHL